MSAISMILVVIVAFIAGMAGILDQWQFHQPIVACTLIGLVTGHMTSGIILGASLQMIALAWANIGAAVAPDAALAAVASTILMVQGGNFNLAHITGVIVPAGILLATAGLVLTTIVRFINVGTIHLADQAAERGSYSGVQRWHYFALSLQGFRIALPAALILAIPADTVTAALNAIPNWLSAGLAIGGGMVVIVGYAMVINIMATAELWPFFFLGFVLAPLAPSSTGAADGITLIGMGIIGVVLALIYLALSEKGGSAATASGSGDPIGDILNDY
ncbi:PTS mannose/fructose/sorbose transporter subunit IIC [Lactococcus lactis subsp. lactis]|uniref:PTS mannose/fructose/sorbose transporter subunit IIC n=1 Tax=Lactococcus TaxID=1357 RepID=UPI001CDB71FF|nr:MULTISPECIES: PTS mannose/fructose/sorbose transporter subunit IIC [Lactococcus]MCA2390921.1 PTS mannose/fructose/sorbose transporter subunit IIC [Lactococcus sp. NH2-7C]WGV29728.1 PTS mannose/fructose/sorbose transporter subunit IIC [Lactococcus sp. NH2-7C]WKB48622.1 PTS mannose/fructose/sorbose transporter subunit IIC [Lactococcus lactis subsp. lactis]